MFCIIKRPSEVYKTSEGLYFLHQHPGGIFPGSPPHRPDVFSGASARFALGGFVADAVVNGDGGF
jgi:hypothetical protein